MEVESTTTESADIDVLISSVRKKQRICFQRSYELIDDTLGHIDACINSIRDGGEAVNSVNILKKKCTQKHAQTAIKKPQKQYYHALTKLSTHIGEHYELNKNVAKLQRFCQNFDRSDVLRVVVMYMLQKGHTELAKTVEKKCFMAVTADHGVFDRMSSIGRGIDSGDLGPALEWLNSNAAALADQYLWVELALHRAQFACLLRREEMGEASGAALAYAREHFPRLYKTDPAEISRLMGSIAFIGHLASSPYSSVVDGSVIRTARSRFVHAYCGVSKVGSEAVLALVCSAGFRALPVLEKVMSVVPPGQEWTNMPQLPVEIDLGNEYAFHSVFACPVSREACTPSNPPILLDCGHFVSKHAMEQILERGEHRLKCPYCPTVSDQRSVLQLKL